MISFYLFENIFLLIELIVDFFRILLSKFHLVLVEDEKFNAIQESFIVFIFDKHS